jgi:hypothetical protein
MAKPPKIREDNFDSLLDRISILREDVVSIERSLERMKAAQTKNPIHRDHSPKP